MGWKFYDMNFMISFPSNKFQYLYYLVSAQYYICCCCWDLLQSVCCISFHFLLYYLLFYFSFIETVFFISFLFVLVCSIKWYSSRKAKLYIMKNNKQLFPAILNLDISINENSATNNTGKNKNQYLDKILCSHNIFISSCILFVRVSFLLWMLFMLSIWYFF